MYGSIIQRVVYESVGLPLALHLRSFAAPYPSSILLLFVRNLGKAQIAYKKQ